MDNKLEYIQKKITNNEINNDSIMHFVIKHKIIYSKNQNGIFINLSKIDKSIIDIFYDYIYNYINQNSTDEYNINYYEQFTTNIINKKPDIIKYKSITGLSETEKKIITSFRQLEKKNTPPTRIKDYVPGKVEYKKT